MRRFAFLIGFALGIGLFGLMAALVALGWIVCFSLLRAIEAILAPPVVRRRIEPRLIRPRSNVVPFRRPETTLEDYEQMGDWKR